MTLKPPGPSMEPAIRVKAIYEVGASVQVNPDTHPKHYLRSGRELLRCAASYQEDGQDEHAYVLYVRFLTIFLEKLRTHPNYKELPASERKIMAEYCNKVLPQAEFLRKELQKRYEKEHKDYLDQVEKLKKQAEEERLAEQKRLEEEKANSRQQANKGHDTPKTSRDIGGPGSNTYNFQAEQGTFLPTPQGLATMQPSAPIDGGYVFHDTLNKFLESEEPGYSSSGGVSSQSGSGLMPSVDRNTKPMGSVDRSTKPSRFLSPISTGLRPLIVPADITTSFLRLAEANTAKNVETCGFLTGKISGKRLIVTDLIIPKQSGTSDTCTTLDENEIFDLQDKHNLITLGWIHTHPTQTAFLSSVDMHTHYSYQIMMPEAIAIVCAPKHNQTGIFTLTPNEGMDEIGSCNANGFHPHKNGLFDDAAHCTVDPSFTIKVHDLRR